MKIRKLPKIGKVAYQLLRILFVPRESGEMVLNNTREI